MSASSIPNLLSLRGNRSARGGLRDRGRGANATGEFQADTAVQGTDTDAAVSRMSAVDLDYLQDEYAPYFVSRADGPPPRRLPIINRGTYARTKALDRLVEAFLSKTAGTESQERQIISLGAGTDTRPFRIFSQTAQSHLVYHELDFPVTNSRKAHTVRISPALSSILTQMTVEENGDWSSSPTNGGEYYGHGIDIRQIGTPENNPIRGLRKDVPTLLLSECCLCYLQPEESQRVIEYFMSAIDSVAVVLYEPMHLDDAFGTTMVSNLAARGVRMPGLERYRNAMDQVKRLQELGFQTIKYMPIDEIWDKWIDEIEKERVDGLEGLDEVEEWKLLAGHYLVCWALKGKHSPGLDGISGNT